MQVLLHKQKLTSKQMAQLADQGVVSIQTDDPASFKMLDVRVPQIQMNDMVWACLDAIAIDESMYRNVMSRFVKNLAKVATERRQRNSEKQAPAPVGRDPQQASPEEMLRSKEVAVIEETKEREDRTNC